MTAQPFVFAIDPQSPPKGLENAIVAVGNFDGVHLGHGAVIARAKALANAAGLPCAVLTFEPHPSDYFRGAGAVFRLSSVEAKMDLVKALGVDGMVVLTFNAALATMEAEAFVRTILVGRLAVGGIIAGYDFHFGHRRTGTPAFLREAGERYGFVVDIVDQVTTGSNGTATTASSTAIRAALEDGDVAKAAAMLGHPYLIAGTVRPGQKLGRTLGFPTANIEPDANCRLRHGIYAVRVTVEGATYDGVASWGRRPTVDNGAPLLESFLFDFDGNLYGKAIVVAFVAWLRGEEKFEDLAALTRQMLRDAEDARSALARDARRRNPSA